jgi:flagellar hook assembly protein FlgD
MTPTVTNTPTITNTPGNDIFYVQYNLFRPSDGPVSIYVEYPYWGRNYSLAIYNSAGEHIRTLDEGRANAPIFRSYLWDGKNEFGEDCATGLYIFYLEEPYGRKLRKILLVR